MATRPTGSCGLPVPSSIRKAGSFVPAAGNHGRHNPSACARAYLPGVPHPPPVHLLSEWLTMPPPTPGSVPPRPPEEAAALAGGVPDSGAGVALAAAPRLAVTFAPRGGLLALPEAGDGADVGQTNGVIGGLASPLPAPDREGSRKREKMHADWGFFAEGMKWYSQGARTRQVFCLFCRRKGVAENDARAVNGRPDSMCHHLKRCS